ncbi:MAG: VanZ family protein [Deltaproteobacteria bacterium]|nr:VanZ family protein [Deltaproteobacteria bacterium]
MTTIWLSSARPWPDAAGLLGDLLAWMPRWVAAGLHWVPADKWVHAGIYGLLAGLWWWALLPRHADRPWAEPGWPWLVAVAFGALDEVHQGFVPGRSRDPVDWLADAIGAALAVAIVVLVRRRRVAAA